MKTMKMFISLAILINLLISAGFAAEVEILPLKDIKVGMKAIGKTVVIGKKIETFDVEILGILSNNKVNENLLINGNSILVKVSGDVIKRAGGIAAGMSGSPVYVENKLIGGISSGWVMTDHTVGLVTPIEEMLEINQYPVMSSAEKSFETVWNLAEPVVINGRTIKKIRETNSCSARTAIGEAVFCRVSADVFVDGLSGKAADNFKNKMKSKNIRIAQAPRGSISSSESISVSASSFEPGSAIGIQLARGDINLSTLGTLTWRDGNKILMLAHSFLKKGNVGYLMTGAVIHHSFAS
ncbi:MAG: SpoIVB peptidase S55 domain-containing protein, partial [Candidatus Riflebacteria bacterium]